MWRNSGARVKLDPGALQLGGAIGDEGELYAGAAQGFEGVAGAVELAGADGAEFGKAGRKDAGQRHRPCRGRGTSRDNAMPR
jgi:hypothetical protein